MWRDAGSHHANGCSHLPPAALRAAAASGQSFCPRPAVTTMAVRTRPGSGRISVRLRIDGAEAFPSGARVEWGDGQELDIVFPRSASHRRTLTRTHRYDVPGLFRLRVVARARPAGIDCFGGGARQLLTYGSRARPVRVG